MQSEKARKFLDLREELKGIEIGLFLYNIDTYKEKLEKLKIDEDILISNNNDAEQKMAKLNELKEKLKQEIYDNILIIINERNYKIKDVHKLKYKGKTIYEYKIILNKYFVCRVAYIKDGDNIVVFYISTNIIKAIFTKEISKLKDVTK